MKKEKYENLNIVVKDTSEAIKDKDIYYQCDICQSIIASVPKDNVHCSCLNIGIDKDMNRLAIKDYSKFKILRKVV